MYFIKDIDYGSVSVTEQETILTLDRSILASLKSNTSEVSHPIFYNRLNGFHPDYQQGHIWLHWQKVWTMLAALKDEEENLRKAWGIDPLVWFARRKIWFRYRMPWLGEDVTAEDIIKDAVGYIPLQNAAAEVQDALAILQKVGWVELIGDQLYLTEQGLSAHDKAEEIIMNSFFDKWPNFSDEQIENYGAILKKLNNHLEYLKSLAIE